MGLAIVVDHDINFVFFILLGIQRTLNRPIWTTWEKVTLPGKTWIPNERGIVLKSTGDVRGLWDLG